MQSSLKLNEGLGNSLDPTLVPKLGDNLENLKEKMR